MTGAGGEPLHALVLEAVTADLAELQRVRTGPPSYNKSWLAERIHEQGGLAVASAKNLLSPSGRLPYNADNLRIRLTSIQTALDIAFRDQRSNGPTGPHDYLAFLAEVPPPAARRERYPAAPPEEDEDGSEVGSTASARIVELFRLAAAELRADRVDRHLQDVLRATESLEAVAERHAVRARACAALATEANTASERRRWWDEALRASRREMREAPGVDAVLRRTRLVVDATADGPAGFELNLCQRQLASVTRDLEAALEGCNDSRERAGLLAAKARVLRHRANLDRIPSQEERFLDASVRCAQAAARECPLPVSVLELGLCLSQRSGAMKSLDQRQRLAREAELNLVRAVELGGGEPARLALASFYRHSHRPLDAVDAFPLQGPHANYRRLLRAAPVLAEAAIDLHYHGYPHDVVERALEDARALLDDAHRAGYEWARHVVDLAFVRAILDGPSEHGSILAELFDDASGDTDWVQVVEVASRASESIEQESFALGVEDSAVWNQLGTYALDFLGDDIIAERMYRQAIRIGTKSYIPRTNLARLLIQRGDLRALQEARKLLETMGSAPPTFPWWRREREHLAQAVAELSPEDRFSVPLPKLPGPVRAVQSARRIEDPTEGRAAMARVIDDLVERCALPRAGELAVTYRNEDIRFEVLWCPPERLTDLERVLSDFDPAPDLLAVLSHHVDQSTETAINSRLRGTAVVTAAEVDEVASGFEQLPALLARASFERSGASRRWTPSLEQARFL